jgi:hypothetical protein
MNAVASFCEYLGRTGDRNSHLYEVGDSPYESLLDRPAVFGEKYRIHVIDPFAQRRPLLVNHDFLSSNANYPLEFTVTLVLDSQMASTLHAYRLDRGEMDSDRRRACQCLLQFASSRGFDYNPLFYLIESFYRNDRAVFTDKVAPVATSLLYLHSMDSDHFNRTEEIRLNPSALDYYFALYGERTLEDCGRACIERFLRDYETHDMLHSLRVSYLCLLKMTLIHKRAPGHFEAKFDEYQRFIASEIGCVVAYESHLAAYYFANLAGNFMRVQPGMDFSKAKRVLWSTAWDLLLLRIPEYLLAPRHLPRVNLGYACSADRYLAELGKLFTIMRLIMRSDSDEMVGPLLAMDLSALEKKVGAVAVGTVADIAARSWRSHQRFSYSEPWKDRIKAMVHDLEMQLANLCRRMTG